MKNNFCSYLYPLIAVVLLSGYVPKMFAAFPNYYFKQLSLQQGLSQSTVSCILKDYKGIIWIGTRMGLNRFDQYELKNYLYDPQDKHSLPDNEIFFLEEDSLLNLWIGTKEGLVLYNRGEDNFTLIYSKDYPVQARTASLVSDGIIFAGAGIHKYTYADRQIHNLPYTNGGKPISDYFSFIKPWKGNLYVVGTNWRGVYLYNITTHELTPFTACSEMHITSYHLDKQNNLWVSPYGKGALCYDIDGKELAHYSTHNSELSNNIVLDMLTHRNELWMATDGGGISRLQLPKGNFQTIENQTGNINSFPVNSVMRLYVDKSDNLWAGTIRGGLLNIREVYMRTFQDVPLGNSYGLSNKTVLCLYEDEDFVYIGTDGGGINRLNSADNTFKHYSTTLRDKVVSITGYSNRELLVALFDKGLFFFDKQTGKLRPCDFLDEATQLRTQTMGLGINVKRLSSDKFLLMADQVYIYNHSLHKFTPAQVEKIRKDADTPIGSLKVIHISDSITYLSGIKNIFRLDNRTQTLSPIYYAPSNVTLNDICRDGNGNFWMATSRGLMVYTPGNDKVKKIETALFNEAQITSLDPAGRVWIGAKGMLFSYCIADGRFTIFGESDGVLTNEYISTANYISHSGDIYLGGVAGLLHISKHLPFKNTGNPSIELMDVQLNGATVNNQLSDESTLTLPYTYTSLVVKVIGNEQDVFRKKVYRFHISGLSKEIESYAPTLALYSLPAGKYDIEVSCSNSDGSWTPPVKILTLIIPTPWWKSFYFITGLIILASGLCIGYISHRIRKQKLKLQWEIKEQREKLNEEKVRFLINMSHELCTPLMLVYAPLKRILHKEMLLDKSIKEQLENVCKHVKRMKNLIEMVLDVRRMEMGQNVLHPSNHRLNDWLKDVAESFRTEYDNESIQLHYDLDPQISDWMFDSNKCEIIISNLLMNALKFSTEGSTVTITTRKEEKSIRIAVSDEGIGLNEEELDKLFIRFYQGNHSKDGNGIGLSYVKALVELQGGKIEVYNNANGKGATFRFELPDLKADKVHLPSSNISLNDVLRFTDRKDSRRTQFLGEPFDMQYFSILIVEDNLELCNFLRDTLQEYFEKVYTANNGKEAFIIASQRLPDIIVSDVMMQQGDGLELCQLLKTQEETNFIPIILLTARTDPDSATSGYNSGADIYLTKPFDMEELILILRNQLRIRKQLQMHYRNNSAIPVPTVPADEKLRNTDEMFTTKLNKIIMENLVNSHLDADLLADKMGMSRTSLYNKVKTVIHVSISDYINKFRIEKALQMLRETNCSILEISEAVGFSNQRYFSTFFKKMVGCTPSNYREENTR